MCGQLYDEDNEDVKFVDLPDSWACPICGAPKALFEPIENTVETKPSGSFSIPIEDNMAYIQSIAGNGQSVIEPSGPKTNVTNWNKMLLLGAELDRKPLDNSVMVTTKTIIGKNAKKPLELETPILVSHMSYGALSADQKTAIAKGAAAVGTAIGSGEGGIYEKEIVSNDRYIFEYVPHKYSVTDENLKRVGAIEIKIGQSAKPGMGGHLPGSKVTKDIAAMRGRKEGEDIVSPPAFSEINSAVDLKKLVDELRSKSEGRPIGIKIAANDIEADLAWVKVAEPDFVTIDGRGGGTGAALKVWKDAAGVPTIYALRRARQFLDTNKLDVDLIITGGLRISTDFAKALSLGADAVAVATGVLTAMASDATIPSDKKVENYLGVSTKELASFARAMGYRKISDFNMKNVATTSHDIATYTDIKHV
jgi:glutamate synthase domain-containing protein 2/rubredoxin